MFSPNNNLFTQQTKKHTKRPIPWNPTSPKLLQGEISCEDQDFRRGKLRLEEFFQHALASAERQAANQPKPPAR